MAEPTIQDYQNAITSASQSGPTISDYQNAIAAQVKNQSIADAYQSGGISGAAKQLASNIKNIANYQPTEEEKMNAAKHPVTGMEDPAYTYGVGLVSETSLPKAMAGLFKSGKAKISGFLSSEEGMHPIIETTEDALSPFKKDIFPMRATREGMAPTMGEIREAVNASQDVSQTAQGASEIPEGMRQIFDPFTKETRLVPIAKPTIPEASAIGHSAESAEQSHGVLSNILHHVGIPTTSKAASTLAGGYLGHKAAEEMGLPGWAGAGAGAAAAAAGPLAIKAFVKTGQGLLPILESPAGNAALRAGISAKQLDKNVKGND